jgi:hypothetical protein
MFCVRVSMKDRASPSGMVSKSLSKFGLVLHFFGVDDVESRVFAGLHPTGDWS